MDNQNLNNTVVEEQKKGSNTGALIFGILSFIWCPGLILGIIGIILSAKGLSKNIQPKAKAVIGLILSILGILGGIIEAVVLAGILGIGTLGFLAESGTSNKPSEMNVVDNKEYDDDEEYDLCLDDPEDEVDTQGKLDGSKIQAINLDGMVLASVNGSTEYVFDDGNVMWCKDSDHSDNYHVGRYVCVVGDDARAFMISNGFTTQEEYDEYYANNEGDEFYTPEHLIVIEAEYTEKCVGGETSSESAHWVYYGYTDSEDFDLYGFVGGDVIAGEYVTLYLKE